LRLIYDVNNFRASANALANLGPRITVVADGRCGVRCCNHFAPPAVKVGNRTSNTMSESSSKSGFSVSRRTFLKSFGTSAAVAATSQVEAVAAELDKVNKEKIVGPEAVPITLQVNGKPIKLTVEPRVTLLDALRNMTPLTGNKEVCDRATCGACSMFVD